MNRFEKKKNILPAVRIAIPLMIFVLAAVLFVGGIDAVSRTADAQEARSLEESIVRGAVLCYALEGFYPEDLSYLEEHYHITYNHDKYIVDYEAVGSNLMPDVRVIPLSAHSKEALP